MKRVEKIKKVVISIVIAIISFPSKIFAASSIASLYGIERPSTVPNTVTIIWRIARTFVIPIALLIGTIIYFKKSKSSQNKKILVTLGIIVLIAILYFVVNRIIY